MNKRSLGKDKMVESTRGAKLTFRDFPKSKENDFWGNSKSSEMSMKEYLNKGLHAYGLLLERVQIQQNFLLGNHDVLTLTQLSRVKLQIFSLASMTTELNGLEELRCFVF